MLLPCDTMSMKNLLLVTVKFFNGEAQLQAAAWPIIILKNNEHLLCYTCIAIWKRWICFSCKYLLYVLPPYSSTSRSYSFIFLYSEFNKQNWRSNSQPTSKQLVSMRRRGINGGPNFINWFWIHVQSSCDLCPPLMYKLLVIFMRNFISFSVHQSCQHPWWLMAAILWECDY
jgi:hypothetical protein